jgi:hypothetical protein
VVGLQPIHGGGEMWAFRLPDGSVAEVFGPSLNGHLTTGPVPEFQVEDVETATEELRVAGLEIVFGPNARRRPVWRGRTFGRRTATCTA